MSKPYQRDGKKNVVKQKLAESCFFEYETKLFLTAFHAVQINKALFYFITAFPNAKRNNSGFDRQTERYCSLGEIKIMIQILYRT